MMFSYTTYEISTGQIIANVMTSVANGATSVTDSTRQNQIAGSFSALTQYVVPLGTGEAGPPNVAERPTGTITCSKTSISANGIDSAIFSNVPSGATLAIDGGTSTSITSTTLTFTATDVGTYALDFSAFPALDQTFEMVAS